MLRAPTVSLLGQYTKHEAETISKMHSCPEKKKKRKKCIDFTRIDFTFGTAFQHASRVLSQSLAPCCHLTCKGKLPMLMDTRGQTDRSTNRQRRWSVWTQTICVWFRDGQWISGFRTHGYSTGLEEECRCNAEPPQAAGKRPAASAGRTARWWLLQRRQAPALVVYWCLEAAELTTIEAAGLSLLGRAESARARNLLVPLTLKECQFRLGTKVAFAVMRIMCALLIWTHESYITV